MIKYYYVLALLLIAMFHACDSSSLAETEMNSAEQIMESHPDLAIQIIESLDTMLLVSPKLQARYALLYSMALDKNYIDVSDDSIIDPATRYYHHHGRVKDKFLTLYYNGRIAMNAGHYADALEYFVTAEKYVKYYDDYRAIARLYKAESLVYQYSYDTEMIISSANKAASYYMMAKDTTKYINTLNDLIVGYLHKEDPSNVQQYLNEIKTYWNFLTTQQISDYYSAMLFLNEYTRDNSVEGILQEYFKAVPNPEDIHWLSVANSYYYMNDIDRAEVALYNYEKYEDDKSLYFYLLCGFVNMKLRVWDKAAEAFYLYIDAVGQKNGYLFNSDINFIYERHQKNLEIEQKGYTIKITSLCCIVLLLLSLTIISKVHSIRKANKLSEEKHSIELQLKEQQRIAESLKHSNQICALEKEKDHYQKMYDEAFFELERLRGTLDMQLNPTVRKHIVERLNLLNKFAAANITPSFSDDAIQELQQLMQDKFYFLESTRQSFILAYPEFIDFLQRRGLSENEIGFCCLYTSGLRGKDISIYMGMSSSGYYKYSSNLRKKFGLKESDTNIDIFLRDIIDNVSY